MQAVILASGRGTRFRPFTDALPKPLLPLLNRPILDHLLSSLTLAGCTQLFVTLGYAGNQIEQFLTTSHFASSVISVNAPEWERGPLASFQAAIPLLSPQEPFVLVPADLYIAPQTLQLLLSPKLKMALLYDTTKRLPGTLIRLDSTQHICEITQSPDPLAECTSSLPVLRATPEFLSYAQRSRSDTSATVVTLLSHWLNGGQSIQGIPIPEEIWCDLDTPRQLLDLHQYLLTENWPLASKPAGTHIPPGTSLHGPIQGPTFTLGDNSQIYGPALIGPKVTIGDRCAISDGTCLGAGTNIGPNSAMTQCITFPSTQVPANVDLKGALLDAQGNIQCP